MAYWQAPAARVFVRRLEKNTHGLPPIAVSTNSPYGKAPTATPGTPSSGFVARHSEPEQIWMPIGISETSSERVKESRGRGAPRLRRGAERGGLGGPSRPPILSIEPEEPDRVVVEDL